MKMNESFICDHCNRASDDMPITVDGDEWCATCFSSDAFDCDRCGYNSDIDNIRHMLDDERWCEPCFDISGVTCDQCGGNVSAEATHTINEDQVYCLRCVRMHAVACDQCGDYVTEWRTVEDDSVCESCCPNDRYCDSCDRYHLDGDCPRDSALIKGHSYSKYPEPLGTGPIYFGVELEVEVHEGENSGDEDDDDGDYGDREGPARDVQKLLGDFVVLKEDGSLNCGFEIVSRPASLAEHRKAWPKLFSAIPGLLRSHDTSSCGLHVHVSREPLSSVHILKIDAFVNENAEFIGKLAGRSESTWARICKKDKLADYGQAEGEKYKALNLLHKKTIEFRVFKGTLNSETFFARLESVSAIVEYTRNISIATGVAPLLAKEFCKWLSAKEQRKTYPALVTYLALKGCMKPTEIKERKHVSASL